jgi:hypothetical protein
VATLSTGQVLVGDRKEQMLHVVSRDGGSATTLSRRGEGPNEFTGIFGLVRLPGDTIAIYAGSSKFLRVSPTGHQLSSLMIEAGARRGGVAPPGGADGSGALYWTGDVVGVINGDPKRNQALMVRRWLPGTDRIDTAAAVADHAPEMHQHRFHPFAQRDAWVVAPDGRVGVVSAREYRLRWYRNGRLVSTGPPIKFAPVPVTSADRIAFRRDRAQRPAGGARIVGPLPSTEPSRTTLRSMEAVYPDELFPTHHPPFVEGGAKRSPGGDIWVARTVARSEATRIDILTDDGVRRATMTLPNGRRLVALETSGIFMVSVDDDGLEWLERYRWPASLR